MNLRSQKGINLITLSVAIIILVLITSVLVYSSKDGVKIRNLKDMYNDVELLDNKIASYYTQHGDIPKLNKYTNTAFLSNAKFEEVNPNNGDDYYVVDLDAMEGITLNYGKDYKELKKDEYGNVTVNVNDYDDLYIINEASHTVYYPRGINVQGVNYYTYAEKWQKVDLSVIPIETAEQLAKIGSGDSVAVGGTNYTFSLDGIYVLKNDIDLSSVCSSEKGSWTPIGSSEANSEANAFTGKLYGNGHTIRGLYINTTSGNQGLFSWNNGTIQDITVEGNITSTNGDIGGVTARNNEKGKIINCNSKVTVTAKNFAGGITGRNYGKIEKCKNYNKIEGTIENDGNGKIGGITGDNLTGGMIEQCYNEGYITGKSNGVGGISGFNRGIITLSINNAVVSSTGDIGAGGISGTQMTNNDAKTLNCYNLKEINGKTNVGGIVGYCSIGQVLNCYSIGTISGTTPTKSVIGYKPSNDVITRNIFYLSTLSTTDENATPKTMEEMKSQAMVDLLNTGQIDQTWSMDTMGINDGYPVQKWQMEE